MSGQLQSMAIPLRMAMLCNAADRPSISLSTEASSGWMGINIGGAERRRERRTRAAQGRVA